MTYWNEFGLLNAQTYENDQNGLLRLAYYHLFVDFNGNPYEDTHLQSACRAMGMMHEDGRWAQHPEQTWKGDRASHDEMTAILYFLVLSKYRFWDSNVIKQIKIGYYLKYPQVIFHLLAIKHRSNICKYIAAFVVYMSVAKKEKTKTGRWDTDSELLALVKIKTIEVQFGKMPMKKKIMDKIKKHWGDNYQKALIDDMLHYAPEHPLRKIV